MLRLRLHAARSLIMDMLRNPDPSDDQDFACEANLSPVPRDDHTGRRIVMCRALIQQRRLIGDSLGFQLCPDPVWDILIDLYLAHHEGRAAYLWQSCVAANIPISSAHRKIGELIAQGLVERTAAMADKRRIGIRLASAYVERLNILMDRLAGSKIERHGLSTGQSG